MAETNFGELVNFRRNIMGMSMRELARRTGVDVSYISKLEKSKDMSPSFTNVIRISQELNIDINNVLKVFDFDNNAESIVDKNLIEKNITPKEGTILNNAITDILKIVDGNEVNMEDLVTLLNRVSELKKIRQEERDKTYYIIPFSENCEKKILKTETLDDQLIHLFLSAIGCSKDKSVIVMGHVIQEPEAYEIVSIEDIISWFEDVDEDENPYFDFIDYAKDKLGFHT